MTRARPLGLRGAVAALLALTGCHASDARRAPDLGVEAGADVGATDAAWSPDVGADDAGLLCPYEGPPRLDPTTFDPCEPACAGAHCMPAFAVAESVRATLAPCTAFGGAGYCVPDGTIETTGLGVPARCSPIPGAPAEGRCLSTCLPAVAAIAADLVTDVCAPTERCVPCFDPITGDSTAACSTVACDAPSAPPYVFPRCCPVDGVDQGRCLPESSLPSDVVDAFQVLTCPATTRCVPDEFVPGSGVAVSTCGPPGVPSTCVSRCLADVPAFLGQGSCPVGRACVACRLVPAGTPGCP